MDEAATPLSVWRRALGAVAGWRPPLWLALAFLVLMSLAGRLGDTAGPDIDYAIDILAWIVTVPLAVAGLCVVGSIAGRARGVVRALYWVAGVAVTLMWPAAPAAVGAFDAIADLRRLGSRLVLWRTPLWFVAIRAVVEYANPFLWDDTITNALRPLSEATALPLILQGGLVVGVCLRTVLRLPLVSWIIVIATWYVVPEALYAVAILDVFGDFRSRVPAQMPPAGLSWLTRFGRVVPWTVAALCVALASSATASDGTGACDYVVPAGHESEVVRRVSDLGLAQGWNVGNIRVEGGTVKASFDTAQGPLSLEVRHEACARPGDAVGPRLACLAGGEAAPRLPATALDALCRTGRDDELPFERLDAVARRGAAGPDGGDAPEQGGWLRWARSAAMRLLDVRPPGFWELFAWIGLALVLVPFALLWTARGHLAPVDRSHRQWLLAILVASAAWRALVPTSGFFMEAHQVRDLGEPTNYSSPLFAAYQWLDGPGLGLAPEDLFFAAQRVMGWLTVPLAFAVTLVLFRRQTLALVAAAFVAFLPFHVKFSASETLTIYAGYLWAACVMAGALWIKYRLLSALVVGVVFFPLLAAAREEGTWQAAVAFGVVAAWGVRETGRAGAVRLAAFLVLVTASLVAFNPRWMTPGRAAYHNNIGEPGGTTWLFLLRKHFMRLVSPRWNAFLDPRVAPLAYHAFLLAGIARRVVDRDDAWRRTFALVALLASALPYMLDIHGNVRPFGEGRYHVAVAIPASWLAAEGVMRARDWLRRLERPAWLVRVGPWRTVLAITAVNHLALVPVLRTNDFDMPMEQAFLAELAGDPGLADMRAVLHPPDDDKARDLNRTPSAIEKLRWLRTGEEIRSIVIGEVDRWGPLTPAMASSGLYYYRGLYCHVMAETCAVVEDRLDLVAVRERTIPANHYNRVSQVRGSDGPVKLILYRVVGIDGYPVP